MSRVPPDNETKSAMPSMRTLRSDISALTSAELWLTLSQTPGIGVSITDARGTLLFVNSTTAVLFSRDAQVDYRGKSIADFHPPAFVEERLALIRRVLKENRPLGLSHIYHGTGICSTIWPIRDSSPPHDRVLVVSRPGPKQNIDQLVPSQIETVSTDYIDLGPLNVLTKRELEVAVLIGHGHSVPEIAATLFRSPKTIERHKESIAKKLCMRKQFDLVQIVTSMGLELNDASLQRYPQ